jgi:threonine/homoserine/homoserine lactone efflux protein
MDDFLLFLQSVLVGMGIAAPVGPIGMLTIQRTLTRGSRAGLATGMGAAAADTCYGALGAFGVSLVVDWLVGERFWLALFGGALMAWLAWHTWRSPVTEATGPAPSAGSLYKCFVGTFLLTLSNPATIFAFLAIFSALSGSTGHPVQPGVMVLGVACGSAFWWWFLTALVGHWRERFDLRWRQRIQRTSALLLGILALAQWIGLLLA